MNLEEYQAQAQALLDSFADQAASKGLDTLPAKVTSGALVKAIVAKCSRYSPGAQMMSSAPEVNEYDILLEAFSAQVTAMALTYGMRALPGSFDQVPGMPGGVR